MYSRGKKKKLDLRMLKKRIEGISVNFMLFAYALEL